MYEKVIFMFSRLSSLLSPTQSADMNGDLREAEDRQRIIDLFRQQVSDVPNLPPDHELQRWIDATSVGTKYIFVMVL